MQKLPDELAVEGDVVDEFLRAFHSELSNTLQSIPWYLRQIIKGKAWEQKADKAGKPFTSFEAWVHDRGYFGLRTTVEHLLTLCKEAPDVQTLIRAEVAQLQEHGGARDEQGSNATLESGRGATYAIARLKRDNPELADEVIAGRLSAHAAAVQAGFRRPTWTAPDDPETLAQRVAQRYPGWVMVKQG